MAERGERATGTPNIIYDLTSVLYHCLESGASYDQYIQDAEEADDQELVEFFTRIRDEDSRRAQEAQLLLAARTLDAVRAERGTYRSEMTSDEAPPRRAQEEFPPRTEDTFEPRRTEEEASPPPPPRTSGIEEGARPATTGEEAAPPRPEEAPSREGAATGDVRPGTEETTTREREGASYRQPEQEEREGDDRGLIERARDALLGEEEPPRDRREGTDRPEDRR